MRLPDGRRITIALPAAARARPRQPYPLLVLHDGQNLFDPDRAFVPDQHWAVAETVDTLIARREIPPLVICGIDHAGARRLREMTPTAGPDNEGGGAARYARMIVEVVLPLVRDEFPVRRDRAGTGLGGSSLGGLVSLYTATEYPSVFGKLLVMSPSVWWDKRVILRMIQGRPEAFADVRIWLDAGRREGARTAADARRLARMLDKGLELARPARPVVRYFEDPAGDHSERSWARRLSEALRFLFGEAVV